MTHFQLYTIFRLLFKKHHHAPTFLSPTLVSQDAPAVVSSILLADSMRKSFHQNDALMKVITMASSNYYYALGLIVGQLLDI